VNLLVVISVEFEVKNPLGLIDFGDIVSDTGADESILEPTIGPLHFALGLRRKRISDFHIAILQDLLSLGVGFIGEEVVFSPERIPSLDESEDAVRVHIIGVRKPISKDDGLEGQDMSPASLCLKENGIEHESAIII
jgi:hypothetical protein